MRLREQVVGKELVLGANRVVNANPKLVIVAVPRRLVDEVRVANAVGLRVSPKTFCPAGSMLVIMLPGTGFPQEPSHLSNCWQQWGDKWPGIRWPGQTVGQCQS